MPWTFWTPSTCKYIDCGIKSEISIFWMMQTIVKHTRFWKRKLSPNITSFFLIKIVFIIYFYIFLYFFYILYFYYNFYLVLINRYISCCFLNVSLTPLVRLSECFKWATFSNYMMARKSFALDQLCSVGFWQCYRTENINSRVDM